MQSLKKTTMGLGTIVPAQWMNLFVQRHRPPACRHRCFEHEHLVTDFNIRPVHYHSRALDTAKYMTRHRTIELYAFLLLVPVSQQTVYALNPMLLVVSSRQLPPQFRQHQTFATKQRVNNPQQSRLPRPMHERAVAFQPISDAGVSYSAKLPGRATGLNWTRG